MVGLTAKNDFFWGIGIGKTAKFEFWVLNFEFEFGGKRNFFIFRERMSMYSSQAGLRGARTPIVSME